MPTERRYIDVRGVSAEVVRKDIKNLHMGVYPPNGRVRVAVPLRLDDDAVRLALISRLGWIRRQQAGFENQDRQSQREFVTGESHYFNGRRYRLDVIERRGLPAVRPRQQHDHGVAHPSRDADRDIAGSSQFIDGIVTGSAISCRRCSPSGSPKSV